MARPHSAPSFEDLLTALARHPEGIRLDALQRALSGPPPRRNVQRRLATLLQQKRVVALGAGRAARYLLPPARTPASAATTEGPDNASPDVQLPTSPEGEAIRASVRRPLQQRQPVGYDQALLEAYTPNQTPYLSASLRTQLHVLGRSDAGQHAAAGTFARNILGRLLIDLSWASSRLEGNTYTRLDTERLVTFGEIAEGKDALETQMILNHKAAIEYLVGQSNLNTDTDTVIALHALLSDGLLRDPMAGGRVRQRVVEISGSVYRPIALPQRLEALLTIIVQMARDIDDPFEQAFFLMVHLPYLQPFEDMNKRVSRLAANIPLMRHNLSPLSFIDVPVRAYVDGVLGVYELGRVELLRDVFVWAYERSCQQYVAIRQQLVPPDSLRLRYRAELGEAIRAIVQKGLSLSARHIASIRPSTVRPADRARFTALVRAEFDTLHAGNAVRFGLRPLELAAWQKR